MHEVQKQRLEAIAERLRNVAHIPINGGPDNVAGKYYGTKLEIGASEISLWHCERLEVEHLLPSVNELYGGEITEEEFFNEDNHPCSSHWQSKGDYNMAAFLRTSREDMAFLLSLLGINIEVVSGEW